MKLNVTFDVDGIAAIPKSQLRNAFGEGIGEAGGYWWKHYLPGHFTRGAIGKYNYTPRDRKYRRRKRARAAIAMRGAEVRSIGEDKPLVWSGRSRKRATRQKNVQVKKVSAAHVYCNVILNAQALNFRYRSSQIDMRKEVTAVAPSEIPPLEQVYLKRSERALRRMGQTRRITKKIS